MYHNCFIHSSVNGHWHVLAIVSSAAVNTGVSFCIMVSQDICAGIGLLGHMVVLGSSILSSIVFVSIYIPTNSEKGFPFCHILSSNYFFVDFWVMAVVTGVSWYLLVVWICISVIMSKVQHLFMCLMVICILSLGKYLVRSSTHFLIELFGFSDIELHELLVYCGHSEGRRRWDQLESSIDIYTLLCIK